MGWIETHNTETGERVLLGEPEMSRLCPDKVLFPLAASRWQKFNGLVNQEDREEL
jgi:hypothetical protein